MEIGQNTVKPEHTVNTRSVKAFAGVFILETELPGVGANCIGLAFFLS